MKKYLALLLALVMVLSLCACGNSAPAATEAPAAEPAAEPAADDLVSLAQAEGELVVYGSCEEEYLAAACENFEKLYGIHYIVPENATFATAIGAGLCSLKKKAVD